MKRKILSVLALGALAAHVGVRANDIEPSKEKYTAIHRGSSPIVIDGDLKDWAGVPVLADPKFAVPKGSGPGGAVVGTCTSCVNDSANPNYVLFEPYDGGTWSGPDDQTSAVQVAWDADNVYMAFTVTDDYHENSANSAWNGDSVQLMACPAKRSGTTAGDDYFLYNYALGGIEGALGDMIVQTETAPNSSPGATTTAVIVRDAINHKTYYEIQMPADALGLTAPLAAGMQFGLGMAINDGDLGQPGQKGWGGLGAHAIVFGKTPEETALVTLSADLPTTDKIFFSAVNPTSAGITFRVNDKGTAIFAPASLKLTVNSQVVTPVASPKAGDATDYTYTPPSPFVAGTTVTFKIEAADTTGVGITFDGTYDVPLYTPIPTAYAYASSAADTSKPGFVFHMSQVENIGTYEQNSLERTEAQLAGLLGPNIADPTVQGPASAPGNPPNPASAPIEFLIPTVINLDKAAGANGNFTPDDQEPGTPGTNGGTDNQAAEVLTWLDLPAGVITMGVNSDDGFRVTIGGANPKDHFAVNVGEFDAGRGATDTIFKFSVSKAGLYAARLIWENGGGDSNLEWFSQQPDGTDILINDTANANAIKAYQAANVPVVAYASSVTPTPNDTVGPNTPINVVLVDGSKPIDPATVKLTLNGQSVTPTVNRSGTSTTINFQPPALLPSASLATAQLVYSDTGSPVTVSSNSWSFSIVAYTNKILPAPIYLETFEEVPLGKMPTGWVLTNMTDNATGTSDLGDPKSDAYLDWLVIDRNQVYNNGTNDFHVWEAGDPDGRVSKIAPGQIVNGKVLQATDLMENKFMYAESDERGGKQVQSVVTTDYDLSGKTDIYVSYHSSYTQNQDNIAVAEYSIDQGKTWLPIRYFLYGKSAVTSQDGSRIAYNADGSIDPVATLTKYVRNGVVDDTTDPRSTNDTPQYDDGTYSVFGDFVEARPFSSLAPFIEGRVNDDTVESHRVEIYRLPQADNQKTVRLRFVQVGTGSWYWGLDDIGFYSIPASGGAQPEFDPVTLANGKLTISWKGAGTLQQTDSLSPTNWQPAPSQANPQTITIAAGSKSLFYRIKQ